MHGCTRHAPVRPPEYYTEAGEPPRFQCLTIGRDQVLERYHSVIGKRDRLVRISYRRYIRIIKWVVERIAVESEPAPVETGESAKPAAKPPAKAETSIRPAPVRTVAATAIRVGRGRGVDPGLGLIASHC